MKASGTPGLALRKPLPIMLSGGLAALLFASQASAATFIVNSTAEPGAGGCTAAECTLREAIGAANAAVGIDTINFNIPGPAPAGGFFTITITTGALPTLSDQVILNGASQTAFTGNTNGFGPEIDIAGGPALAAGVNGLRLTAGGSTIRGLVIRDFPGDGILINGATADLNKVEGCYIGVDPQGLNAIKNDGDGIEISGAAGGTAGSGNLIGGTSVTARNIISGNGGAGIRINGAGTEGHKIQGNFIGINRNGFGFLGNTLDGVLIEASAGAAGIPNTVGGDIAGALNVISSNTGAGVRITGGGTDGNIVAGNYIGTNSTGTASFSNLDGVRIEVAAKLNTIGGTTPLSRNVISGNQHSGVRLRDTGTDSNKILGNYLGVGADGIRRLGNQIGGVSIGSYDDGSGNGPGASGVANVVGGATIAARNIISGNGIGVIINGFGSDFNQVQGNFIGLNAGGTTPVPNSFDGVLIGDQAKSNALIGVLPTPNNPVGVPQVISGNKGPGVRIGGSSTDSNRVFGCQIGTNPAGLGAIANQGGGIVINAGAGATGAGLGNIIGGTTSTTRNIISGNRNAGILVSGVGTDGNQIQGNFIGTQLHGTSALGNWYGIRLDLDSLSTTVSGSASGPQLISGNQGYGIEIQDSDSNKVQGNFIGLNVAGSDAVGNGLSGVLIAENDATSNLIGGNAAGLRNIISGNGLDGVSVDGANTNQIQGNYIGTDAAGTAAVPNLRDGVGIFGGSSDITVGGIAATLRNVISGNAVSGVAIYEFSFSNDVQANYIGTSFDASAPVGNGLDGVDVFGDAHGNNIGGSAATGLPPGNVISGNGNDGVAIWDRFTYSNLVQGNIIGTNSADSDDLGNGRFGINVFGEVGSANLTTTIGGTAAGHTNLIRFNGSDGIRVGNAASLVVIRRNHISANGGLGINLQPDGEADNAVTLNDAPVLLDADAGPNGLQNFPVLTLANRVSGVTTIQGTLDSLPDTEFIIELFRSAPGDPSGHGEGQTFIKVVTVTTDANGHAVFSTTANSPLGGEVITATATRIDPDLFPAETSEFSASLLVNDPSFAPLKSSGNQG